jgi:hypothetical protein
MPFFSRGCTLESVGGRLPDDVHCAGRACWCSLSGRGCPVDPLCARLSIDGQSVAVHCWWSSSVGRRPVDTDLSVPGSCSWSFCFGGRRDPLSLDGQLGRATSSSMGTSGSCSCKYISHAGRLVRFQFHLCFFFSKKFLLIYGYAYYYN